MNNGDFIVILISTGYVNLCFTLSLGGWSDVMIATERERESRQFSMPLRWCLRDSEVGLQLT